ncbi:MAG: hypothetical protein M3186_08975 [Actinomycetota bacterium]|nr:hypothetical protein [Actinomycetota bacterium]
MCVPQGHHARERTAVRHGHSAGSASLGGRWVPVTRPRIHAANGSGQVAVPSYEPFSHIEVLGRMALERMFAGSRRGATSTPAGAPSDQEVIVQRL